MTHFATALCLPQTHLTVARRFRVDADSVCHMQQHAVQKSIIKLLDMSAAAGHAEWKQTGFWQSMVLPAWLPSATAPAIMRTVAAAAGDFYNVSSTTDITPYTGTPFGFHPRSISGFQLGFPAIFDNRLSQNDSQRLLTVLTNGNYLDVDTATLTARLLTFNSELKVYG